MWSLFIRSNHHVLPMATSREFVILIMDEQEAEAIRTVATMIIQSSALTNCSLIDTLCFILLPIKHKLANAANHQLIHTGGRLWIPFKAILEPVTGGLL